MIPTVTRLTQAHRQFDDGRAIRHKPKCWKVVTRAGRNRLRIRDFPQRPQPAHHLRLGTWRLINTALATDDTYGAGLGNGRGERIRTSGLTVPNRALYQAELRPVESLLAPTAKRTRRIPPAAPAGQASESRDRSQSSTWCTIERTLARNNVLSFAWLSWSKSCATHTWKHYRGYP